MSKTKITWIIIKLLQFQVELHAKGTKKDCVKDLYHYHKMFYNIMCRISFNFKEN